MVLQASELKGTGPIGFVLAGGQSRRMGRDKARLPWSGATLLDHALERLRDACADVRVLCGPGSRYADYGVPEIVDALPGAGPLAGIQAGLAVAGERGGLFLAVDLPFVPGALLRHLAALGGSRDVVVPVSPRGPEPLCAFYGAACLAAVTRSIDAGDRKVSSFWTRVRVRRIGPRELRTFGDPARLFLNLNAPGDLQA